MSRTSSDLSLRIKKVLPVISKSVNELIKDNFTVEEGYAPSSGGRRPLQLDTKVRSGGINNNFSQLNGRSLADS